MKKKEYISPSTQKVMLWQAVTLLAGSGEGPNPDEQEDPDLTY